MAATTNDTNTIWFGNLPEKIPFKKWDGILRDVFEEKFGPILEVVAKGSLKRKGQAFVVFESHEQAARCHQLSQGFVFCDKVARIEFAHTKSDAQIRKFESAEAFEEHKKRRMAERDRRLAQEMADQDKTSNKRPAADDAPGQRPAKKVASTKRTTDVVPAEYLPPNNILFVEKLSFAVTLEQLSQAFSRFPGFKEVRMVPKLANVPFARAFVEYDGTEGAIQARENMQDADVGNDGHPMNITYQRQ